MSYNIKEKYTTTGQDISIQEKLIFIALVSLILVYSVLNECEG